MHAIIVCLSAYKSNIDYHHIYSNYKYDNYRYKNYINYNEINNNNEIL